ncbi:glutaredoxin [Lottiidibacillus patelloidae]|uniref:Glutaredoxin n=1 Tax=Lottiidibacillus patelloidae TaxID=2670334 RepID=A0A263BQP7_9BACI|nr:glutaredoxin family protein [Lottiidibacillus patelloidae]OZM56034.1 glutaredoxin [Lottiidibacillus patelloidae]
MKVVTFYTKENCPLCEKGLKLLEKVQLEEPFQIEVIDIYQDDELLAKYQIKIPVIAVGEDEIDCGIISYNTLRKRLL